MIDFLLTLLILMVPLLFLALKVAFFVLLMWLILDCLEKII